jgi:predicted Zn-dependent protease
MVKVTISHSGVSDEHLRRAVCALKEFEHETGIKLDMEVIRGGKQVQELRKVEDAVHDTKRDQVDADSMLNFFEGGDMTKDRLWLHLTDHDLYGKGTNFVFGGSKGNTTLYSVKQFEDAAKELRAGGQDPEHVWRAFKLFIKHEVGHSLKAVTEGRKQTEKRLGTHCANGDVMKQAMNIKEAIILAHSLRGKNDFCPHCLKAMREHVKEHHGEHHLVEPHRV